MPAAAVIPAPLAYTIIVAFKRLVVGLDVHLLYDLYTYLLLLLQLQSYNFNTVNKSECIKHVA